MTIAPKSPSEPIRETPRYRVEDGESIVDIKLASVERVFDNRDPAPFRERNLDPQLVEYLVGAAEDLVSHERFRIIFWLEQPCPPGEIEVPYRAHFEYELERIDRVRRRQRRAGWIALALAIVSIVVLVSLSELVARLIAGSIGAGLKEGLVISGWVLMWRPIEVLVYDSIPWRRARHVLRRLVAMPIEVRAGKGPTIPS
jgi:hypothetical protein